MISSEKAENRRPLPSSAAVSKRMALVRQRDTACEMLLRRELHRRGLRYRVHTRPENALRIRADIVFRLARVAVFVDGCFWHSCPEHGTKSRSNAAWWDMKLATNSTRDRANTAALESRGWTILRFWEHEDSIDAARVVLDVVRTRFS